MYTRVFIFLLLLFIPASFAHAVARAPFPSASKLQPIPESVQPNVSGNIQSSLTPAESPVGNSVVSESQSENVDSSVLQGETSPQNRKTTLLSFIAGFTVISLAVFVVARRRLNV